MWLDGYAHTSLIEWELGRLMQVNVVQGLVFRYLALIKKKVEGLVSMLRVKWVIYWLYCNSY